MSGGSPADAADVSQAVAEAMAPSFELLEDEFSDIPLDAPKSSDTVRLAQEFLSGNNIFGKTFTTHTQAKLFMVLSVLHKSYPWANFELIATTWGHTLTSVGGKGRNGVLGMLRGNVDLTDAARQEPALGTR